MIMKQINMKYTIYFNKKYKRVGPLWQGRFKSKYVWDSSYLETIVKYIEHNPIRADIVANIGDYKYSMSSKNFKFSAFNYELINKINLKEFNDNDWKKVNDFFNSKVGIKNKEIKKIERKKLGYFFNKFEREKAIIKALKNGHTQSEIAQYLGLSIASVSKLKGNYQSRERLFNKLRYKGIFWSFDKKKIEYENFNDNVFIEYVLKYGDFDDIKEIIRLFGKRRVKKVWARTVAPDKRFLKVNLMIARVFFNMDVEANYFKGLKNERLEKLRMLAT